MKEPCPAPVSVGTPNVEAANALWEAVIDWKLRQAEACAPVVVRKEIEKEEVHDLEQALVS